MHPGLRKKIPIGEEYTGIVAQGILQGWRRNEERPCVCTLCRHIGAEACPFRDGHKPDQGFCDKFSINATNDEELNALFLADCNAAGVQIRV